MTTQTAALNVTFPISLDATLLETLPQLPAHLPAPQATDYDLNDGQLLTTHWFSIGNHLAVRDTDHEWNITGEYLNGLNEDDTYAVEEWAKAIHQRIEALLYTITLESNYATNVPATVVALATGRPVPEQAPGPATDELGILAEAEIVNAMSNESSIRYAQDEDTVRDGTVRGGRWSAEGLPDQGKSIHDAHVRITLSTGLDVFKPFTVLVHMLQAGEAYIRDRD